MIFNPLSSRHSLFDHMTCICPPTAYVYTVTRQYCILMLWIEIDAFKLLEHDQLQPKHVPQPSRALWWL